MAHRISPAAEADLDAIWYFVAKESASIEVAESLIDPSEAASFFLPDTLTSGAAAT